MTRPRKISLLLADVDGTLVTHEKILTERARNAVHSPCTAQEYVLPSRADGRPREWPC